jgi:hypothetical protein
MVVGIIEAMSLADAAHEISKYAILVEVDLSHICLSLSLILLELGKRQSA